jgi:hypothetical protein
LGQSSEKLKAEGEMNNHELLDLWRATLDRHYEPLDYVAVLFGAGVVRTTQEHCARVCDAWQGDGQHVARQLATRIRQMTNERDAYE